MSITAATIRINANPRLEASAVSCSVEPPGKDPYRLKVRPGDMVVWDFGNTPDYRPAVVFTAFTQSRDFGDQAPLELGIFESLGQEGGKISGVVGQAGIGSYEYWIWLLPLKPGLSYRRLACDSERKATIIDRLPPG